MTTPSHTPTLQSAPTSAGFIIADRLLSGYRALDPHQRAHVEAAPTLSSALQRTLRTLYGCQSWVTDPTPVAGARMVAFDLAATTGFEDLLPAETRDAAHNEGLLACFDVHSWAAREWGEVRLKRNATALLRTTFDSAKMAPHSTVDLLGDPTLAEQARMRQAAVLSWWGARAREGYDRTSALFLLRLIADARVFATIE